MPSPAPTSDVKLNTVSVEPMVTVAASSRKPSVARASPSCGTNDGRNTAKANRNHRIRRVSLPDYQQRKTDQCAAGKRRHRPRSPVEPVPSGRQREQKRQRGQREQQRADDVGPKAAPPNDGRLRNAPCEQGSDQP